MSAVLSGVECAVNRAFVFMLSALTPTGGARC
ncbi:MAG: hypothetical protein KatS3mg074_176 [Meiothermus sp.]|uniref:Uncharacterized protein n=1 Tax=Meiothermus hypogaeus TaxID=884155 RepID=A0ABX9MTH6_9DEIN|nr:hypothetical protein Mhypo_00245 [Meiothermus hypogaeus]GIW37778.1 MAG: hypothetical protein KatS3mg074_176 [Meiothermus sp.]